MAISEQESDHDMLHAIPQRQAYAKYGFALIFAFLSSASVAWGQTTATTSPNATATDRNDASSTSAAETLMLADSSGTATQEPTPTPGVSATVQPQRGASPHVVKLIASFTVFLLAVFVGFEVITKVPPTLHTPLMSGSNAISGITIVGALLAAGHYSGGFGSFLGLIAVIFAMINVVGGFLVTHRMLKMFKKR